MNDYNNSNRYDRPRDGQRSDRRRSGFGSRNSGRGQMHDAICADCGNNCKVPFMPSSGKPVYCSDCFERRGNGEDRSNRPNFSNRREFSHSDHRENQPRRTQENYSKQLATISIQLDKIIKALTSNKSVTKSEKQDGVEVIPVKTEKKAKAKKTKKVKNIEDILVGEQTPE